MGLELKIKKTAISETAITFSDTTGNYNINDNPTGYGTPNPDRSAIALFVLAYNKRYNGSDNLQDTKMVADVYNPMVSDSWTFSIINGGWVKATVYGLKPYSTTTEFELSELVYDVSTMEIRKILTKSGSGTFTYTYEVVNEDALKDSDNNYVVYTGGIDTMVYNNVNHGLYNMNKSITWMNINHSCDKSKADENWGSYRSANAMFTGMRMDDCLGYYAEAQKTYEAIEGVIDCFMEENNCSC